MDNEFPENEQAVLADPPYDFAVELVMITSLTGNFLISLYVLFFVGLGNFFQILFYSEFVGLLCCIPAIIYMRAVVYVISKTGLDRLPKTYFLGLSGILFFLIPILFIITERSIFDIFDLQMLILLAFVSPFILPMIYWIWKKDPYKFREAEFTESNEFDDILDRF